MPVKIQSFLSNGLVRRVLPILIHGLVIVLLLVLFQDLLESHRDSLTVYMPPIGFALMMLFFYGIQPILIGVLNIMIMHQLYGFRGWQVGFWLNGIFLILLFTTVNLVLEKVFGLSFLSVAVVDVVLLSFPFGCVARFSNGGWKKPIA